MKPTTDDALKALRVLDLAVKHVEQSKLLPSYAREAFAAAHLLLNWQGAAVTRLAMQVEALRTELQELRGGAVLITNTPSGAVVSTAEG